MSAENSDGGGRLNRAWNNVKSIFRSSNDPSTASKNFRIEVRPKKFMLNLKKEALLM